MSEDEDDYMSDKFLSGMEENDIRPGLIYNRSAKRKHESIKERNKIEEDKKKKKNIKQNPNEVLQEGLQQPLPENNKGFALLQKMGFNPGAGLGKSGEGRKDPVPIEIKNDRYGLGRKSALREVANMKFELLKVKQKENDKCREDYLIRIREKAAERSMETDLFRSQRVCFDLDTKNGVTEPGESWFWPPKEEQALKEKKQKLLEENDGSTSSDDDESTSSDDDESNNDEEEEINFTASEKLQILTLYIRKTYFYCIWCGIEFDNEEDIEKECPGSTREDH